MSKATCLYEAHGARFLAPQHAGSSVRWAVSVTSLKHEKTGKVSVDIEGEVSLTDCSRVINWGVYQGDLLTKVQGAIAELKAAEKALKKAKALEEKHATP